MTSRRKAQGGDGMSKDDAIAYCTRHRDRYVRGFGNLSEGARSYKCLLMLLESETIKPQHLPVYGMDLDWDKKDGRELPKQDGTRPC
jgi:hypothetical protein